MRGGNECRAEPGIRDSGPKPLSGGIKTDNEIKLITLLSSEKASIEIKPNDKPKHQDGSINAPKVKDTWSISATKGNLLSLDDIILILPFTGELDW